MKKGFIVLFFILFISLAVFCQGIDKFWIMGYGCCSPHFSGMNLDFNSGSLSITAVQRYMNFSETNGLISDASNNLLFYSNGLYVANALDDTMLNGGGLNPSTYTTTRISYGLAIPQANVVIPFPDDSTKYYLFHETCDDYGNTYATYYVYYSIIDMTLDSGRGAVIQKNTVLLHDSLVGGRLTVCKHANGRDWWLIAHKFRSSLLFKYLITPQGIQGPWTQDVQTWRDTYFGQCVFSQQGDKFAYYEPYGDLDIMDFDRCTGDFSNIIHVNINDSASAGGVAFSSSGRYLYVPSTRYLYQFDTWTSNVPASQLTVGVYDGFSSLGFATSFYLAQLAPDGKIYIICGNATMDIHVVNYPDSADTSCGFCQHCIHLPAFNGWTIPNFPNYFLGYEAGTVCDSLRTGISNISSANENPYSVFPNPVRDVLYVIQTSTDPVKIIKLFNSMGQSFSPSFVSLKNNEYLELNTSGLIQGVYFLELSTSKQKKVRKFVKE